MNEFALNGRSLLSMVSEQLRVSHVDLANPLNL